MITGDEVAQADVTIRRPRLMTLPHTIFTNKPARQKAIAAMPWARTAKKGGVWSV